MSMLILFLFISARKNYHSVIDIVVCSFVKVNEYLDLFIQTIGFGVSENGQLPFLLV